MFNFALEILGDLWYNRICILYLSKGGRYGRPETEIILYNLGKFSQVIGDYEVINFTLKPKSKLYGFCAFLKYTAGDYYPEG